eukprot:jgi/Picsp_1/2761/NSC_00989-R1_---NA---
MGTNHRVTSNSASLQTFANQDMAGTSTGRTAPDAQTGTAKTALQLSIAASNAKMVTSQIPLESASVSFCS